MAKWRAAAVVSVLASTAAGGCWLQPGADAGRTNFNSGEATIASGNVGELARSWEAPLVSANVAVSYAGTVFASGGGTARAVDGATGQVRWTTELTVDGVVPQVYDPAYLDGEVLVPYGSEDMTWGGIFHLDADTGEVLANDVGDFTYEIAVAGGEVVARTFAFDGDPAQPERGTQTIGWDFTPTMAQRLFVSPYPSSFAVVGERIVWSLGTTVYGFSAACPVWEGSDDPCNPDWHNVLTSGSGISSPGPVALDGDSVVVALGSRVYVLNAVTGELEWRSTATSSIRDRPAVAGGKIVTAAGTRIAVWSPTPCGADECPPLWAGQTSSSAGAGPVVAGDVFYVPMLREVDAFPLAGCGAVTGCEPVAQLLVDEVVRGVIVDDGRVLVSTYEGITAFTLAPP